MTDIASLGIKIDTSDVAKAEKDLDGLKQAGQESEAAAKKIGSAWKDAASKISGDTGEIVRQLREMNKTQGATVQALSNLDRSVGRFGAGFSQASARISSTAAATESLARVERQSSSAFRAGAEAINHKTATLSELERHVETATAALAQMEAKEQQLAQQRSLGVGNVRDLEAQTQKVNEARANLARLRDETAKSAAIQSQSNDAQAQSFRQLVAQIDPVTAAMQRLDAQQEQLAGFRAAGLVNEADFNRYRTQLDQTRASLSKVGNSSKQTAFALRQLPAQFSDIFISLQAGQSPLQVFLQQGAQIKDSFGGIGPALRETGRFALGLVNPFTVAALAVGALAFAYKQGSDEQTAYNKALILTGNYAGTTSVQLERMAQRLDGINGTQRQAARTLAEFAGTGRFVADQLDELSAAAIAMENATGKAVSETVAEFVRLADSPSSAIAELNKSQRFLTAEIYSQITALEEQGRTTEAAELAMRTYADTLTSRSGEVTDRLGYIERAWKSVKEGAAEAWDEMLGVGRESTPDQELNRLQSQLDAINKRRRFAVVGGSSSSGNSFLPGGTAAVFTALDKQAAEIERRIKEIQARVSAEAQEAQATAARQKIEADAVAAIKRIDELGKAAQTNAEKRKKALEQLARDIEKIRLANPDDFRLDSSAIAKLEADIREKFKDPKAPTIRDDAATRMLQTLRQQQASLQEQLATELKLTDAQKERVKFEQLIADLKDKKILTAEQKSLQASQDAIRAQLDKNVALAEENRLREESNKLAAFQANVSGQTEAAKEAYQLQLATVGLGKEQSNRLRERLQLEQQMARQQRQLLEQFNRGDISKDLYDQETSVLESALAERLALQQDYYRKLEEEQGNWVNGATAAFSDFSEQANDIAGQTYDLISGTLDTLTEGIGQGVAKAVLYGDSLKDSFDKVALSITENLISALAEMGARYLINAAIGQSVAASATATNITLAATTAAAWAPAAAAVSLASYGANAPSAQAGISTTYALTQSLSALGGFMRGGYTGNAGKTEIAGVVHGKEFVFDADSTARIGVENLERIRSGRSSTDKGGNISNDRIVNVSISGVRDSHDLKRTASQIARQTSRAIRQAG